MQDNILRTGILIFESNLRQRTFLRESVHHRNNLSRKTYFSENSLSPREHFQYHVYHRFYGTSWKLSGTLLKTTLPFQTQNGSRFLVVVKKELSRKEKYF